MRWLSASARALTLARQSYGCSRASNPAIRSDSFSFSVLSSIVPSATSREPAGKARRVRWPAAISIRSTHSTSSSSSPREPMRDPIKPGNT